MASCKKKYLVSFAILDLALISLNLPVSFSTEIIVFQPEGIASLNSTAIYNGDLDRTKQLESVTLCIRLKFYSLHYKATLIVLKDTISERNFMIGAELWLFKLRFILAGKGIYQVLDEPMTPYRWYHICFLYDKHTALFTTYVNGIEIYRENGDLKSSVFGDSIKLGQGDTLDKSYRGELAQVNIWDYALSKEHILKMLNCEEDFQGNYVSWNGEWIMENVISYVVPHSYFCEAIPLTSLVFPNVNANHAFYICESLGTHLPYSNTFSDIESLFQSVAVSLINETRCSKSLWTSVTDIEDEGNWVHHYNDIKSVEVPWKNNEPNGLYFENCAEIRTDGIVDVDCDTKVTCAICKFQNPHPLVLRGACLKEPRNMLFIPYQAETGELTLKSIGDLHIIKLHEKWQLIDIDNNETLASMAFSFQNYPMGRKTWTLHYPMCNQPAGNRILLLTPCSETQYSCDNAQCIPLDFRCDQKYDCKDHSDEVNCSITKLPQDYKNEILASSVVKGKSTSLSVEVEITIESLVIDTVNMYMDATFEMKLTWFDGRIKFTNIKTNSSFNRVPVEYMLQLWVPKIRFVNSGAFEQTKLDESMTMVVNRLSKSIGKDETLPAEVDLYEGSTNSITAKRKYTRSFLCQFNLVLYPFDVQFCSLHLRLISGGKSVIAFNESTSNSSYIGNRWLSEYVVGDLKIDYLEDEESELKIQVPLSRLSGYSLLNIYLPSIIMLAISYMTLFFRVQIFEVRAMSALTTLLVMETLFVQVTKNLPTTSYFKMIDLWLIFCTVLILIILLCHTVIDNSLDYEDFTIDQVTGRAKQFLVRKEKGKNEKKLSDFLILVSRIVIFAIFAGFNIIYWSIILTY